MTTVRDLLHEFRSELRALYTKGDEPHSDWATEEDVLVDEYIEQFKERIVG